MGESVGGCIRLSFGTDRVWALAILGGGKVRFLSGEIQAPSGRELGEPDPTPNAYMYVHTYVRV